MTMLYQTQVTKIGEFAAEALDDNMMILFDDNAPADVADYCYIHPHAALLDDIKVGGDFVLGQTRFPITALRRSQPEPRRIGSHHHPFRWRR